MSEPPAHSVTRKPPSATAPLEAREASALLRRTGGRDSALLPLFEVNERCLTLLAEAARSRTSSVSPLVIALRRPLLAMTPESHARAARRPTLLVDMAFRDPLWWREAKDHPRRATRGAPEPEVFPGPSVRYLARATLVLAWHSLRNDALAAGLLLGISRPVADILASLPLAELDAIAERRYRSLRPRWDDQPALWRQLLLSGTSSDFRRGREFILRSLQLVSGELLNRKADARGATRSGDLGGASRG
jgi:hypothetical protein